MSKRFIPYAPNAFTLGILFDVAKDGTSVNLFRDKAPIDCKYEVMINSRPTEQSYDSLTFKAGDYVLIRLLKGDKFPWFAASNTNYISKVLMPLPMLSKADGTPVTDMTGCFRGNSELVSVCSDLFMNNSNVNILDYCFADCPKLTLGIEESKISDYSENVEEQDIENIPTKIIKNIVNIGLPPSVTSAVFFANNNKQVGTVFVNANTKTATTFKTESSINVIEE